MPSRPITLSAGGSPTSMSVIAVQGGQGPDVLDRLPESARESLTAIETISRTALWEMQRLVDLLRDDSTQPLLVVNPIVFVSEGDGTPDIFLMNRAAAETVRVTRDVGFDGKSAAPPPDGGSSLARTGVRGPAVSHA